MTDLEKLILSKLDKVNDKIEDVNKTLAVNTKSLDEHMRRTELAEKGMEKLSGRMEPIEKHVQQVNTVLKVVGVVVGGLGTLAAFASFVFKIIQKFKDI